MVKIRSYVPKFPKDYNWKEFEDFIDEPKEITLYLTQFYFLTYLAVFILGMLMSTSKRFQNFSDIVQSNSIIATMVSFYILTSPRIQTGSFIFYNQTTRESASTPWITATLVMLGIVVALALWHRQRTKEDRPAYLIWGEVLIGAGTLLILANLFFTGTQGGLIAIGFNFLFFAGTVWLVFAGIHINDKRMINIGFVFFAITLITRYFDTFWSLMNRSFFADQVLYVV